MARFVRPPRGVFTVTGDGQGNLTIVSVNGTGEYFSFQFQLDDYFEYAIENLDLKKSETGIGTIVSLPGGNLGVFSRQVDRSTDNNQPLNVAAGVQYTMFLKTSDGRGVTVDPVTGSATNPEAISAAVFVATLTDLRVRPIPGGPAYFYVPEVISGVNSGRGGYWEWRPGSTAAFQEPASELTVNVIKNPNYVTGRYHRVEGPVILPSITDQNRPVGIISRDSVTTEIVDQKSIGKKIIPAVENYYQGAFASLAALLAVPHTRWRDNDRVLLRGLLADNDVSVPIYMIYNAADTDTTAALGVTKFRPDSLSAGAAGRFVYDRPSRAIKFANSDATPSVKNGELFICADTVPAAITNFTEMRNGQRITVLPGTQNQTFTHSSSFKMPGGRPLTLATTDAPITFIKENDVIWCLAVTSQTYASDGGQLADAAIPTVAHNRRYDGRDRTFNGFVGLADNEWIELTGPSSGSMTFADGVDVSGTAGAGNFDFDGDGNLVIPSTYKGVLRITREGTTHKVAPSDNTVATPAVGIPVGGVGGTANAITLALVNGPVAADGLTISFTPTAANTNTVTVAYNGGAAIALKDGTGAALASGALSVGVPVLARYVAGSPAEWRLVGSAGAVIATGHTASIPAADRAAFFHTPMDRGAVGDGVANDRAALAAVMPYVFSRGEVLNGIGRKYALGNGAGLVPALPASGTVRFRDALFDGSALAVGTSSLYGAWINDPHVLVLLGANMFDAGYAKTNLTVAALAFDEALTVASTAGLAAGDVCLLHENVQWSAYANPRKSEKVVIKRVVNSTSVELWGKLRSPYSTSATLRKYPPVDVIFENCEFKGNTTSISQIALAVMYCRNVYVEKCKFYSADYTGLAAWNCAMLSADQILCDYIPGNGLGYGINPSGTNDVNIGELVGHATRHLITGGSGATANSPLTRTTKIDSLVGHGCIDGVYNTHPGSDEVTIGTVRATFNSYAGSGAGDGMTHQGVSLHIGSCELYGYRRHGLLLQPFGGEATPSNPQRVIVNQLTSIGNPSTSEYSLVHDDANAPGMADYELFHIGAVQASSRYGGLVSCVQNNVRKLSIGPGNVRSTNNHGMFVLSSANRTVVEQVYNGLRAQTSLTSSGYYAWYFAGVSGQRQGKVTMTACEGVGGEYSIRVNHGDVKRVNYTRSGQGSGGDFVLDTGGTLTSATFS